MRRNKDNDNRRPVNTSARYDGSVPHRLAHQYAEFELSMLLYYWQPVKLRHNVLVTVELNTTME